MLFLSLPGNLFIGGLEEAGWTYVLQPRLDKKSLHSADFNGRFCGAKRTRCGASGLIYSF